VETPAPGATGPPFPEELNLRKICGIVWCYLGSMEQANTILGAIRSDRPPAFDSSCQCHFRMLLFPQRYNEAHRQGSVAANASPESHSP
jgi:hypothetical protein